MLNTLCMSYALNFNCKSTRYKLEFTKTRTICYSCSIQIFTQSDSNNSESLILDFSSLLHIIVVVFNSVTSIHSLDSRPSSKSDELRINFRKFCAHWDHIWSHFKTILWTEPPRTCFVVFCALFCNSICEKKFTCIAAIAGI